MTPVSPSSGNGKYRAKAESLTRRFIKREIPIDYEKVRDETDLATGSDLDCTQLDILASMIFRRMQDAAKAQGGAA